MRLVSSEMVNHGLHGEHLLAIPAVVAKTAVTPRTAIKSALYGRKPQSNMLILLLAWG
jgi:hypothetical protein